MAKFLVFDWLCDTCHQKSEWIVDTSEAGWDGPKDCRLCGEGVSHKTPSGPPVQNATLLDGTKRKGWEDMKAVAKLEVLKAGTEPSKRYTIEKEINERKKLR